jgi:nucleoside-diphosphate-sugar epimerase
MTIRWIIPLLGTAPYSAVCENEDIALVDVRELVDKAGNTPENTFAKIQQGVDALRQGKKTVVCCDYGISRSNAVAAGILSLFQSLPLDTSLRRVQEATGEFGIKLEPIVAVREALGVSHTNFHSEKQVSILITGGSGFLGTALFSALKDDYKVMAPLSDELDLTRGSTALDLLVAQDNVQWIVHLANPIVYTSNLALGQTLTMLRNVLEVCRSRNIALLYPSFWEVYSGYSGTLLADESTPPLPNGPYGETKYLAEILIKHFCQRNGLRCALLRSSPVYGAGSDRPKFLHNFARKAVQSRKIITHRYDNGEPFLDLLHVSDLIDAFVRVIKSGFEGELHLGTGVLTSTRKVAQMISQGLNSSSDIAQVSIRSKVASIAMDWKKASQEIGWAPETPFIDGLQEILSAYDPKKDNNEKH